MNATNFNSPLAIAQTIPIYMYVNIISNFLFMENQLKENDHYKHIPIINAFYKYYEINAKNFEKKLQLVRKILSNTDLYGSKSYENLDETFINTMLEYFVKTIVFEKYTNINGFLLNVTLSLKNQKISSLIEEATLKLTETTFENEYGLNSKLSTLSIKRIIIDFILPLFPINDENLNIFSPNYLYALAGLTFFRSIGMNLIFYSKKNVSDKILLKHEMYQEISFNEFREIGQIIEQMILGEEIDKIALTIFTLPALLYYCYKEKEKKNILKIQIIVNNPNYLKKAIVCLFSYLDGEFKKIKHLLMIPTAESEFYSAVSIFKNRTDIAREIIENNCLNKEDIEKKIENYKNNNNDYYCYNFTKIIKLPDLREKFMQQITDIKNKCFNFEYEKLKKAFGNDFINTMNRLNVEIYHGFYLQFFNINYLMKPIQILSYPYVLFKCYFPSNSTTDYYALIIENNLKFQLIKESDNYELFREKLKFTKKLKFSSLNFPYLEKKSEEKFEFFLIKLAAIRTKQIGDYLQNSGYHETDKEWWINFGLSLIPFHDCISSIFDKYQDINYKSCIIDSIMLIQFFPFFGKITNKFGEIVTASIEHVYEAFFLKQTLKIILKNFTLFSIKLLKNSLKIFNGKFLKNFGIALLRLIDPGFELLFQIGKGGLKSIKLIFDLLRKKFFIKNFAFEKIIAHGLKILNQISRTIAKKFENNNNIYVNSFDDDSAYGFKYIKIGNKIDKLKSVAGKKEPYIFNKRSYKKIDPIIGKINNEEMKKKFELTFEMTILNKNSLILCEGGNFLCLSKETKLSKKNEITRLKNLELEEPELFYTLQNEVNFQSKKLNNKRKMKIKIHQVYDNLEINNLADQIFDSYTTTEANLNLKFEDYLALRHYGANGYQQIRSDLDISRRMKNAIYRLSIRQSHDTIDNYETLLFRGEIRDTNEMEKIFYNERKEFELQNFASTSNDPSVARQFCLLKSETTTRVMYQMKFERPYLRANVEQFMPLRESETILLPGTKFKINEIKWKYEGEKKVGLTVKLSYDYDKVNLFDWQKMVMCEIKKLKESGTIFYVEDLKK